MSEDFAEEEEEIFEKHEKPDFNYFKKMPKEMCIRDSGIVGAVIGSLAAISIDSGMLRKIFAVFLVFMGIGELRKK